jgi:hypothetical protein
VSIGLVLSWVGGVFNCENNKWIPIPLNFDFWKMKGFSPSCHVKMMIVVVANMTAVVMYE